jgi:hypothetical protein
MALISDYGTNSKIAIDKSHFYLRIYNTAASLAQVVCPYDYIIVIAFFDTVTAI